jgi:hypothetical protein
MAKFLIKVMRRAGRAPLQKIGYLGPIRKLKTAIYPPKSGKKDRKVHDP